VCSINHALTSRSHINATNEPRAVPSQCATAPFVCSAAPPIHAGSTEAMNLALKTLTEDTNDLA
jgi:hypothetical protein